MNRWKPRGKNSGPTRAAFTAALLFIMVSTPLASGSSTQGPVNQYYSTGSWALGVVVSENSPLSSGGEVSWVGVNNVTAVMRLPEINQTDGTIYAILSVMTADGSILQVAAGLTSNSTAWSVYAMWIRSPTTYPQEYKYLLISGIPGIAQGSPMALSIYSAHGVWNLYARDFGTNRSVHSVLTENVSSSLRVGDQEVFALESYSSTSSVFAGMGNLTLYSILVNGLPVAGSSYFYGGGWSPSHQPLFVVGGGSPPSFVIVRGCGDNVACWSSRSLWGGVESPPPPAAIVFILLATVITVVLVTTAFVLVGRRRNRGGRHAIGTASRQRILSSAL